MIHKLQLVKEDLFLSCFAKYGCLHEIGSEKGKKTIDYSFNMNEQKVRINFVREI